MKKLDLLLVVVLVVCALAVVSSQHRARKLFIDLEAEQERTTKLEEEYRQLKLEQSTWAAPKRVADVAERSLGMRMPDAATTVTVAPPKAAPR